LRLTSSIINCTLINISKTYFFILTCMIRCLTTSTLFPTLGHTITDRCCTTGFCRINKVSGNANITQISSWGICLATSYICNTGFTINFTYMVIYRTLCTSIWWLSITIIDRSMAFCFIGGNKKIICTSIALCCIGRNVFITICYINLTWSRVTCRITMVPTCTRWADVIYLYRTISNFRVTCEFILS